jgi:hypothetical protein
MSMAVADEPRLSKPPETFEGIALRAAFLERALDDMTARFKGVSRSAEKAMARAEQAEQATRNMAVEVERLKRLLAEALTAPRRTA